VYENNDRAVTLLKAIYVDMSHFASLLVCPTAVNSLDLAHEADFSKVGLVPHGRPEHSDRADPGRGGGQRHFGRFTFKLFQLASSDALRTTISGSVA